MKNLCLYLMAMAALLSIIVITNVLAMEKMKQDDLRHRFEDTIMEIDNFLFYGTLVLMREFAVTIFNLFIPAVFLIVGAGLAWNWWFSFLNAKDPEVIQNSSSPPPTNTSPQHHHNLREKRQKHFI